MAIAKFETGSVSSTGSKSGGGSNTLFILIGLGLVAYFGYKYWYIPKKEKEKNK